MPTLKTDSITTVKRLKGIFTKYVDDNPDSFSRQDGAYLLLDTSQLHEMITYIHRTRNGAYIYSDSYIRVKVFFLLLNGKEVEGKTFFVFSDDLPAKHKNIIENYLLQEYCLCNEISIKMFISRFRQKL